MSTIPDDVGASISSMLAVFLTNIAEEEEEEEEEEEAARVEFFFRAKEAGAMADRAVSEVNIASVVLVLVILVRNSYDVNDKFSWLKMKKRKKQESEIKKYAREVRQLCTQTMFYILYTMYINAKKQHDSFFLCFFTRASSATTAAAARFRFHFQSSLRQTVQVKVLEEMAKVG